MPKELTLTKEELSEGKLLAEMLTAFTKNEESKVIFDHGINMLNTGIHIGRQQAS